MALDRLPEEKRVGYFVRPLTTMATGPRSFRSLPCSVSFQLARGARVQRFSVPGGLDWKKSFHLAEATPKAPMPVTTRQLGLSCLNELHHGADSARGWLEELSQTQTRRRTQQYPAVCLGTAPCSREE